MIPKGFDPAPRSYAPFVSAVRRSARGPASAPAETTVAETVDWLLQNRTVDDDPLAMIESFFWRLRAAGLPVDRGSFHVGTLHPQIAGYAWNWRAADGLTDEVIVSPGADGQDAYLRNPLRPVFEKGEAVRGSPARAEDRARFRMFEELHAQGVTDYVCRPIGRRGARWNAATFATTRPGGFTEDDIERLNRIFDLATLHIERRISDLVARNVAAAYLGEVAGAEVLRGAIARGDGRAIRAVIWVSDMRGFSERADRLLPGETTAMLNLYFEALAGAVTAEGGDVLKFIGDGLLAVFPTGSGEAEAAVRALRAARAGLARLARLNEAPPEGLAAAALPLETGIALHLGEVFFGNVGAPDRLDFTVIGAAVNEAARVEALTKALGRPILLTEPVAALAEAPLEEMGAHPLRGVSRPVRLFAG